MIYDKDIREPLFEYLDDNFGKNRVIEEKRMGKSRADIVVILPGKICGIEIKSDADTYARLSRQCDDYDAYFDENILVVGSSHALHAAEHIPDWWGILSVELTADGKYDFYEIRKPDINPKMDQKKKLSILWRPELAKIQEINEMPAYKGKSKLFVIEKILEKIPKDFLNIQISEMLFERDYNAIAETINAYRVENGQKKRINTKKRKRKYKRI